MSNKTQAFSKLVNGYALYSSCELKWPSQLHTVIPPGPATLATARSLADTGSALNGRCTGLHLAVAAELHTLPGWH